MTFSRPGPNVVPTSASAVAASRGSCVSTSEAVIVRGRSGVEGEGESWSEGMSGLAVVPVAAAPGGGAGEEEEVDGGRWGDAILWSEAFRLFETEAESVGTTT